MATQFGELGSIEWSKVRNFHQSEWQTDPLRVSPQLVYLVDECTTAIKNRFPLAYAVIHVAYETSGHAVDSQHYLGLAVDLHFANISLLDQFLMVERFPFTGVGLYPFWTNPGVHLDIREVAENGGARWWRGAGGEYKEMNAELFKMIEV